MLLPGILASGITGNLSTNNFTSIATATVDSSGASSITFSSIPSTYTHLQIRGIAKDSRGSYGDDYTYMQFNGDSGNNYSTHRIRGDGSSAFASASINASKISFIDIAGNGASNIFGVFIIDILDYANTNKNKITRSLSGVDVNGTVNGYGGPLDFTSGAWYSTSAINSITFTCGTPNFLQYTQFSLYGVK
jgi:hypothetical protein